MSYGFVIDHRKCIGCHACTVACKAENAVPLGSFRTWVKYVEKGSFPEVKRHFTVLRCNHCDEAPCVEICPVVALHKRPDAIVDLDRDQCIGCRSCMQACPYDALYLNEDTGVAEKCHYCAHRTELGLEPSCVVVCPERAIVPGDTDDPESEIATLIREQPTQQRRLDKGTKPRVWYVDALEEALVPGQTREPDSYLWSERRLPPPPVVPGFEPTPDILTTLDVAHSPAWGWHIWAYLMTKNVAAGVMMVAASIGVLTETADLGIWPEIASLVFLAITSVLLVHDLGRPERFLKILFHPNPRSWLVKGAWVISAFGALTTLSLVLRLVGADAASDLVRWINLPVAVLTAGYSAFLFGQCKGRELWQQRGLFLHLVLRAALMGAGLAMVLEVASSGALAARPSALSGLTHVFTILALANALWLTFDLLAKPRGRDARRAHEIMIATRHPTIGMALLYLAAVAGMLAPLGPTTDLAVRLISLLLAVAGLLLFERAWIRAPQLVPNS